MSLTYSQMPEDCRAVREILDRVGDKWSLFIVGSLREGPRRFNELKRVVEGISQRMLTLTLRGLERDGLVARTIYPTIPPRVDYELTELGRTLLEPVLALVAWVDQNKPIIENARVRYDAKCKNDSFDGSGCSREAGLSPTVEFSAADDSMASTRSMGRTSVSGSGS